ncbi:MAG TPA: LD-carboxypeptidase [Terriglobales bacterium]|nr:LD-carboxypeptidase [Terriglobales bacterium]
MSCSPQSTRTKPVALQPGDTVGIVAPASNIQRPLLEAGCERLRELGYKPFYLESIFDQDLYFAGAHERRTRELEEMFERDEVRAILCARGGYGANYLVTRLNPQKIVPHPKIFVGYSDITTLLTCFCDTASMVTFHGPMVTKDFAVPDGIDLESWTAALTGISEWQIGEASGMQPLVEGTGEGTLYGGCLSMLAASLGTPHEVRTGGTILFIEDVSTKPFQIDRMLMQLLLAGKFKDVKGIIFGEMLDCVQPNGQRYSLEEVVMRIVGELGVPVAFGLRSGHVSRKNITLPLGVRAGLNVNATSATLKILEPATVQAKAPVAAKS